MRFDCTVRFHDDKWCLFPAIYLPEGCEPIRPGRRYQTFEFPRLVEYLEQLDGDPDSINDILLHCVELPNAETVFNPDTKEELLSALGFSDVRQVGEQQAEVDPNDEDDAQTRFVSGDAEAVGSPAAPVPGAAAVSSLR